MSEYFYIFPSDSRYNAVAGIKHGLWAVHQHKNRNALAGKARQLGPGDQVLLYLNGHKQFIGPFTATSRPNDLKIICDVWDGEFHFPFSITYASAVGVLSASTLSYKLPSVKGTSRPWTSAITKFRGMTTFCRQYVSKEDYDFIMKELSENEFYYDL